MAQSGRDAASMNRDIHVNNAAAEAEARHLECR
jgi:hypothetical protein